MQSMIFQVDKCKPEFNEPKFCKSNEEIVEYIKDLQVQLFVVEQSLDIRKKDGESVKKTQTLISDTPLYFRESEIP